MIDTDKYEGHTPAPWYLIGAQQIVYDKDNNPIAEVEYFAQEHHSYYNKALITDAPLLLAEVKRLRERVKTEKNLKLWEKSEVKQLREENHVLRMIDWEYERVWEWLMENADHTCRKLLLLIEEWKEEDGLVTIDGRTYEKEMIE